MDYLTKMMELQEQVNSKHEWIRKESIAEQRIIHLIDAMDDEVHELKREFNWKKWKRTKPLCRANIEKEMTDCLVFFVCLCLELGLSPKKLFALYESVSKDNIKRQREGY